LKSSVALDPATLQDREVTMAGDLLVRLIFSGLIAFAPVTFHESPGGLPSSGIVALMPEALGDTYAADGCPLPEHIPGLFISAEYCWKVSRWPIHFPFWLPTISPCRMDPELALKLGDPLPSLKIRFSERLRGWQISLFPGPLADPPPTGTAPAPRSRWQYCPRNPGEETDPSWIPDISGMDQADSTCLSGAGCRLAARAKIRGGKLLTCHLLRSPTDNRIAAFRFQEDSAFWSLGHQVQAVADTTMLDLRFAQPWLGVHFERLGDPDKSFNLLLTPLNGQIQLWVADLPDEVMAHGDACSDDSLEKHDEIYYNVLARRANGKPVALADRPYGRRDHTCPVVANETKLCDLLVFDTSSFGIGQVPNDRGACGMMSMQGGASTSQ
jgi:hypothetical protein